MMLMNHLKGRKRRNHLPYALIAFSSRERSPIPPGERGKSSAQKSKLKVNTIECLKSCQPPEIYQTRYIVGFQLPTSTGYIAGFLNHQPQYVSFEDGNSKSPFLFLTFLELRKICSQLLPSDFQLHPLKIDPQN